MTDKEYCMVRSDLRTVMKNKAYKLENSSKDFLFEFLVDYEGNAFGLINLALLFTLALIEKFDLLVRSNC